MEIFQMALLFLIIYIAFYALVDRICRSCEVCAMYKAYGKAVDMNKVEKIMNQESK